MMKMMITMTNDDENNICPFCKEEWIGRVCNCGAYEVEKGKEHLSLKEQWES